MLTTSLFNVALAADALQADAHAVHTARAALATDAVEISIPDGSCGLIEPEPKWLRYVYVCIYIYIYIYIYIGGWG